MPPVRVLVVDDEEEIRVVSRHLLERAGMVVVAEAGDGVEAVAQARCHQPDLVVLDIMMPRMDGLAALEEIRRVAPGARVVMHSADERRRQACLAAGAAGWVTKGRSWKDLRQALVAALAGSFRV